MSFSYNLPDEILLIIFNLCDLHTLLQINRVCKQFYRVTCTILKKRANYLLVTNEISKKFRERCKPLLSSYKSKYMIHKNWIKGLYTKKNICKVKLVFSPNEMFGSNEITLGNICKNISRKGLITENLFWSYDNHNRHLFAYNRAGNGTLTKNKVVKNYNSNIFDIIYCSEEIISGHQDGSIRHWRIVSQNKKKYLQQSKVHFNVHVTPIENIDATSQYIISCSERDPIKIKKNIYKKNDFTDENEILYSNTERGYVHSISIDPTETKFAAGIGDSILIYDIYKNFSVMKKKICAINVLWEDPHTILAKFGSRILKIDIRTSKIERIWKMENEGNFITCFSSDNLYTIVTGTEDNQVLLWDQRKYAPIQAYNINDNMCDKWVHFVQFDSTHLYAGTRYKIFEFDFMGKQKPPCAITL